MPNSQPNSLKPVSYVELPSLEIFEIAACAILGNKVHTRTEVVPNSTVCVRILQRFLEKVEVN